MDGEAPEQILDLAEHGVRRRAFTEVETRTGLLRRRGRRDLRADRAAVDAGGDVVGEGEELSVMRPGCRLGHGAGG